MPRPTSILRSGWLIGALSALCLALILVSSPAGEAEAAARLEPGRLWMARYSGYGKTVDQAQALAVSPDGSTVFVTGYSGWGTDVDYATVAFDAGTGTPKWVARYNGTGNAIDQPNAIAVSPDGASVFVTGLSWGSGGWYDYATVAYDAATGRPAVGQQVQRSAEQPGRGLCAGGEPGRVHRVRDRRE